MSSTELVTVEPLLPMEPDEARVAMAKFQALTDAMLNDDDWQRKDTQGRPLARPFVKRSGWRKISTGYSLSCQILSEEITRDEDGQPIRAHVRVLVTHPSGRQWEGSGGCSILEPSFNTANKRAKAEHDIPGTAFTRAANRATSDLVGFGQVSAEEVDGAGPDQTARAAQPWGPVADDEQMNQAANLVRAIAAPVEVDGERFIVMMGRAFDGVPQACVKMLRGLARYIGDARARAGQAPPEDVPPDAERSAYHNQPDPQDVYPGGHYQGD